MNWWIKISVYKMKSGKYFVLDIPKQMREVGYGEECYEEDSYLFAEDEIGQMDNEEYGLYSLTLKPINKELSYNKVIEEAKQKRWNSFIIESFVKNVRSQK